MKKISILLGLLLVVTSCSEPDNLINDIFDPFVTSKSNGTGLGLSLVSKIVAGHGGLIECTSHSGNTTFCVRLPIWRNKKDQN